MDKKKIFQLHSEHNEWLNRLDFYKQDIKFLADRVEEISAKNSDKEVLALCEHYSNSLDIQLNEAQKLKHAIKNHEKLVKQEIHLNPIAVDHRSMDDHAQEREAIERFELIFTELRKELLRFFSKWM